MVRSAVVPPRFAGLVKLALQAGHHRDGLSPGAVSMAGHAHVAASAPVSLGFAPAPLRSLFDESPAEASDTPTGYRISRIAASSMEVDDLRLTSEELKIEVKALREGRDIIQKQNAELQRENAELKSKLQEHEQLKLEIRELKSKLQDQEKLKLENEELKGKDREAVPDQEKLWKLFSLKRENQELKSDLETVRERNEFLRLENEDLVQESSDLGARLEMAVAIAEDALAFGENMAASSEESDLSN